MADYNNITIEGRVGRDPELRFTSGNKALLTFSIAVSGKKVNNNYTTSWFKIIAWESLATDLNENIKKGQYVRIKGRFSTNEYTDRDGNKRSSLEVTAAELFILEEPGTAEKSQEPREDFDDALSDSDIPF